MAHTLQHPLGFFDQYMEEVASVLVGGQQQDRFTKDLGKVLVPQQYSKQPPAVFASGPKACAQCGTTRTPQWREGPEGPKTLCNACGVKRVRQMRTNLDGSKRRSAKVILYKQDSSDVPLAEDYYEPRDAYKRPLRKAAARAAAKTAGYVNKGEWGEEEEYSYHSSQDTGSADSAGHNSDSAEEVAWVPERYAHPRHVPPSPMANAVGPECAAAVNLLSMSVHDQPTLQTLRAAGAPSVQRTASGGSAKDFPKINASSYAQMANSALKWNCHLPAHADAQEQIHEALKLLPAEKHAEMLQVKEELDAVSREAAAADAAVAAVAKILAIKQAAAIRARASAAQAAKRIQKFMQNLDEEQGLSRHTHKKPRL